jgi:hypothetical protein
VSEVGWPGARIGYHQVVRVDVGDGRTTRAANVLRSSQVLVLVTPSREKKLRSGSKAERGDLRTARLNPLPPAVKDDIDNASNSSWMDENGTNEQLCNVQCHNYQSG